MSLRIIKPGPHTTIQDLGRFGFQSQGVPISGAMDEESLIQANLLVGNDLNSACLELAMGSTELEILGDTLMALCGTALKVSIGAEEIPTHKAVLIKAGTVLKLMPASSGCWSYLSVGGGFLIEKILNSHSTYTVASFGGFKGRILKAADELSINGEQSILTRAIQDSIKLNSKKSQSAKWGIQSNTLPTGEAVVIRICAGHEWNWLSEKEQENFQKNDFTISSDSNRMGYRLNGATLKRTNQAEMISTAVTKGTIQLTNEGSLIVLMADGQTVGGYPRVGQVAAVDISTLVQRRAEETIRFKIISFQEAEQLFLVREKERSETMQGIKFKFRV